MADVLSQSQIDALLNSMNNTDEEKSVEKEPQPKQKYRKYDFYSPKKYTKDKLKLLRSVYDNYSRIATSQINGLFRVASEVQVVGVEEQRYYEFGNALNETDIIALAKVEIPEYPKNPPMVFHVSPVLMGVMIDKMLGGTGMDTQVDGSYVYTDIEIALYESIIQHLTRITKDVWRTYIHMDIEFDRIEENPSMFQGISVDETVVIVMLKISMGEDMEGAMNICIPGTLLFNIFEIIEKTKHLADQDGETANRNNKEEIMESIKESEMEVTAQLGVAKVNLDDVYNLHVGDIIDLNKPQDSEISLQISGQPWFTGKLGVYNKNIAVKIEDRAESVKSDVAV